MIETTRGWRRISLAEAGDWFGGGTPSKGRTDFWEKGNVPWLSPKDMGPEVITSTQDHITDAAVANSSVRRVPGGSIALVVRSGILERTLPIAVVPFEMTLNQDMKALVPRPGVDARWVAWWLRSREQELLRACRKSGTTVASIETKALMAQELPVPSLDQQRRIVAILEAHLSRLDAAAVGLDLAWRRVRLMLASATEALRIEAAGNGENMSLGSLAIASSYGTSAKCVANGPGQAVVRIPNLVGGIIDLSDEKRVQDESLDVSGLMLDAGDLLFVRTNGSRDLIGRTGVVQEGVRAAFASYLIRYKLDVARLRPQWVHLMMRTPSSRRLLESIAASSAGQYNLSLGKLDQVPLPVPSLDAQDRLLARSRSIEDAAGRLRAELTGAEARRIALRRSLLTAAFAGRLTGRSGDDGAVEELASV